MKKSDSKTRCGNCKRVIHFAYIHDRKFYSVDDVIVGVMSSQTNEDFCSCCSIDLEIKRRRANRDPHNKKTYEQNPN